ncbi:MAG: MFS transporter [Alphaproteobacteria bacterium]|nr:MFS transporter [Alphaproteobacteria bacterium]
MAHPHQSVERLPATLKAGWAVGAVGHVTMLIVTNTMLLFFLVSHLGVAPATAGLILAASRFYDMFADVLMGHISDRTRSRWGRRRPWMVVGAIGSGIGCVLAFWVPDFEPGPRLLAYLVFAQIVYFTSYTIFTVPFMAMPAEMTTDYNERTSIMSYRTFFSGIAGLVGMSLAPSLVKFFGGGRAAYAEMGIVIAVIVSGAMLLAVFGTRRARFTERTETKTRWKDWVATALTNRPFAMLFMIKFVGITGIACAAAVGLFFQGYITGRAEQGQSILGGVQHVVTMASIPMWLWISRAFGKRAGLFLATAVYFVANISWWVSGPEESMTLFVVRATGLGLGYAGFLLMTLSMLPDTIAYDTGRTGLKREGIYAGLFAFVEKASFVVAPLIVGSVLGTYGFVQSRGTLVPQTEEGLFAVKLCMAVIPAGLTVAVVPFVAAYNLTREKLEAMEAVSAR